MNIPHKVISYTPVALGPAPNCRFASITMMTMVITIGIILMWTLMVMIL